MKYTFNTRIARNLRCRLCVALKRNQKKGSAVRDLGCTVKELITYLESQFQVGMCWDNYGSGNNKWNIDHIMPLSKFDLTKQEQVRIACNYKNLRPLWQIDNIRKSNKTGNL